jgi:hypothetical protein
MAARLAGQVCVPTERGLRDRWFDSEAPSDPAEEHRSDHAPDYCGNCYRWTGSTIWSSA